MQAKIRQLEKQIEKAKNNDEKVLLLLSMSALVKRSDVRLAEEKGYEALEIARRSDNLHNLGRALYFLADINNNVKTDTEKALELALEAMEYFLKANDNSYISRTLGMIGRIYTNRSEFLKAHEYLLKGLEIAIVSGDADCIHTAHNRLGMYYHHHGEYDAAIREQEFALQAARSMNNIPVMASVLNNLSLSYLDGGNYAQAYKYAAESLLMRQNTDDITGISNCHIALALVLIRFNDYEKALEHLYKALALRRGIADNALTARILFYIGGIYFDRAQFRPALEEFLKSKELLDGFHHPITELNTLLYIGASKSELGDVHGGIKDIEHAYRKLTELQDIKYISQACCHFAAVYRKAGENNTSLFYGLKGIRAGYASNFKEALIKNYLELAITYNQNNQFLKAQKAASKAAAIAEECNNKELLPKAFKILAESYLQGNDFQKSVNFYKRYVEAKEEFVNDCTNHKIQTLLVEFDVEQMKHEAEINKLKSEQYERELALKNKELTTLALHLVNKNEFLKTIGDQISEDVSNTSQIIKNLSKLVENDANTEAEWKLFEKQFIQVNPDFTTRLAETSGENLTATELKICSLLRTGLNSQDVANVLFLSKRTVENHRYNIHRKLKLGDEKLIPFLMKL